MHWVTMRAQYAAQYTLGGAKMVATAYKQANSMTMIGPVKVQLTYTRVCLILLNGSL